MAFDLLKSAKHVRGLSHAEFRVLFYLLDSANNNTLKCFPSVKEIADRTEMGERTVHRHIATLVERGFFERIEQRRRDGSRAVNCYRFRLAGSIQLGDQPAITIDARSDPETEDEQPATGGRLQSEQPATGGTTPCHGWQDISQELSQELNSPSAYAEAPQERELFELEPDRSAKDHIAEYVERRWAEIVEANDNRISSIRKLDDGLRHTIELRGKQHAKQGERPIDVWRAALENIATSRFLRGLVPPGPGRDSPFRLSLGWACKAANFREILNGAFNRERDPNTYNPVTGKSLGPAAAAAARAIARQRAAREQRAGGGDRSLPPPGGA